MSVLVALIPLVLALLYARLVGSLVHTVVGYLLLWCAILLVAGWDPLNLLPLNGQAALMISVGLLAFFAGSVAFTLSRRPSSGASLTMPPGLHLARWLIYLALGTGGLLVAVVDFRDAVDLAGGGVAFSALSATEVRYLSDYGAAAHLGIGGVLFDLAPLVAAGGVILGKHRYYGYAFLLPAIVISAQNLSRTSVFYTVLAALVCWLYYQPGRLGLTHRPRLQHRRLPVVVLLVLTAGGLFTYFQVTANELNKSATASEVAATSLPGPLIEPTLYLTGSPEALSTALDAGVNPAQGEAGRSIWLIPRALSMIDPAIRVPNTVAAFVDLPHPYNTYTWVGDLWFDFGWVGIVVGGLLLGTVSSFVDAKVRRVRSPLWCWWAAAWTSILLASVIAFEVFWLQTLIWLVAGLLIFGSWPHRRIVVHPIPITSVAPPRSERPAEHAHRPRRYHLT